LALTTLKDKACNSIKFSFKLFKYFSVNFGRNGFTKSTPEVAAVIAIESRLTELAEKSKSNPKKSKERVSRLKAEDIVGVLVHIFLIFF
jgi:hypothetical protein